MVLKWCKKQLDEFMAERCRRAVPHQETAESLQAQIIGAYQSTPGNYCEFVLLLSFSAHTHSYLVLGWCWDRGTGDQSQPDHSDKAGDGFRQLLKM